MHIPDPRGKTANITWDDADQPISTHFDDIYFSKENGLQETEYVFLDSNNLKQRFSALNENSIFRVAETGFGTGLNFLATCRLWNESVQHNARLEFISIEKYPLNTRELDRALSLWPELKVYAKDLIDCYPPQPWKSMHRLEFTGHNQSTISLTILFSDVIQAFQKMTPCTLGSSEILSSQAAFGERQPKIDAWFLDGFAPAKNPEMWSHDIFEYMALNSHEGTTFSTFTSAGQVRRELQNVGFLCQKKNGFGHKREMLFGEFKPRANKNGVSADIERDSDDQTRQRSKYPNWILNRVSRQTDAKTAIIIGAGLAGAQCAFALAQRGIHVTVLDKKTVGSGASSNLQGAVFTRLSPSADALSEFNKQAQFFADQFYKRHHFYEQCGDLCGVIHLANTEKDLQRLSNFVKTFAQVEGEAKNYFSMLAADDVSEFAHIDLKHPGLLIKKSGWLHPSRLCEYLLKHENINVVENEQAHSLEKTASGWSVDTKKNTYNADICVVCNAIDALSFEQLSHLPIKSIRGQVTHIQTNSELQNLKAVICGEGYLCPATEMNGELLHSLGATYNLDSKSPKLSERDQCKNLDSFSEIFSSGSKTTQPNASIKYPGKVGFRSTTPDYFPIVGPVPRVDLMLKTFEFLGKRANARIDKCTEHYPGLYCCLGFGSRGLAYTALSASIIGDLVTGSHLPISREIYSHLHPARFSIRALIKNKTYS